MYTQPVIPLGLGGGGGSTKLAVRLVEAPGIPHGMANERSFELERAFESFMVSIDLEERRGRVDVALDVAAGDAAA